MLLRTATLVLLSAVVALGVGGCGNDPRPVTPAALDGTDWASSSVTGRELAEGSKLTLAFENDLLSASAGCNSINGKYAITRGVLQQKGQFRTMMACIGIGDQEAWFAGFLSKGAKATLLEHTLTLEAGGTRATFVRAKRSGPPPVVGTRWTLIGGDDQAGVALTLRDSKRPTLELTVDGKAKIFTGCNRGGGPATFADGFVTFGPIITTQIACEPAVDKIEQAMLSALKGKTSAGFESDHLVLARGDGSRMVFSAH